MTEYSPPRCEVIPLADQQVSLRIDGREIARWNASPLAPRPYLYPLNGPSGACLTRMGHPGASNHDHHRSVWFAHHKLLGIDFWSEDSPARIRQLGWSVYQDGADAAVMAVRLGWFDGHDPQPLVEQEVILVVRPLDAGEYLLDWQVRLNPSATQIEFQKTNFGFLAVRVAKSLSAVFGAGMLTDSEQRSGEKAIFGQMARWVDYSGPLVVESPTERRTVTEGITYFDHPSNPTHPSRWHVRDDGWMGCAPCLEGPLTTTQANPLSLRYGFYIHSGPADRDRIEHAWTQWHGTPRFSIQKGTKPHHQFELGTGR